MRALLLALLPHRLASRQPRDGAPDPLPPPHTHTSAHPLSSAGGALHPHFPPPSHIHSTATGARPHTHTSRFVA